MTTRTAWILCIALALSGCVASPTKLDAADAHDAVMAVEASFARTMADRDLEGFAAYLADEAVFLGGPTTLRGKQQILEVWAPFFDGPDAPFSWEPEIVEVLGSGTLAFSTGPVRNADGKLVARFSSIWRRESSGAWRIVFDQGNDVCD